MFQCRYIILRAMVLCLLLSAATAAYAAKSKTRCLNLAGDMQASEAGWDRWIAKKVRRSSYVAPKERLFHQVPSLKAIALKKEIGTEFQDFPKGWLNLGQFRAIWTAEGRPFYDQAGPYPYTLFELHLREGWEFARHEDIVTYKPSDKSLFTIWEAFYRENKQALPRNRFSKELQENLRQQQLPTHSDFYHKMKVAGYMIKDGPSDSMSSFVFIHYDGGAVRLLQE